MVSFKGGIGMFSWLASNLATVLICAALAAAVAAIVLRMVRNKKKGCSSCGCGCGNCAMSGSCLLYTSPSPRDA